MKFGRRFAAISQNAWWAAENINYKQLKKTLKRPADNNSSEYEGAFLSAILCEVQKVNTFFVEKESRFDAELKQHAAQQEEIKSTFDALLRRNGLSSSARLTRAQVIELARSSASAAAETLATFFALCEDIESLRQFAFLNYLAVIKILKKHDKNSGLHLRDSLIAYVDVQPFHVSAKIAALSREANALCAFVGLAACDAYEANSALSARGFISSDEAACARGARVVGAGEASGRQPSSPRRPAPQPQPPPSGAASAQVVARSPVGLAARPASPHAKATARLAEEATSALLLMQTQAGAGARRGAPPTGADAQQLAGRAARGGGGCGGVLFGIGEADGWAARERRDGGAEGDGGAARAAHAGARPDPQPRAPGAAELLARPDRGAADGAYGADERKLVALPGIGRTLKPGGQRKLACDRCHRAKAACEGYPCRRCARMDMQCTFSEKRKRSHSDGARTSKRVQAFATPHAPQQSSPLPPPSAAQPSGSSLLGAQVLVPVPLALLQMPPLPAQGGAAYAHHQQQQHKAAGGYYTVYQHPQTAQPGAQQRAQQHSQQPSVQPIPY